MPCLSGGGCGVAGFSWQQFTSANFIATVDSGGGVVTDNPGLLRWDVVGATPSTIVRLTPSTAFAAGVIVRVGNCWALTVDVRDTSQNSLFSGTPAVCSTGTTVINATVGYILVGGTNAGAQLPYGYFNFTGTFSSAFWQSFWGQYEST